MFFKNGLAGVCLLTATAVFAAQDYAALDKDLEIMGQVLATALEQPSHDDDVTRNLHLREVKATYLLGQGVVFTIYTHNGRHFRGGLMDKMAMIGMPMDFDWSDIDIEIEGDSVLLEFDDNLKELTNNALRYAQSAVASANEKMQALREQERDLQHSTRELSRHKQNLDFERQHADADRAADLQAELAEVEAELNKMQLRRDALAQRRAEAESQRKEQRQQQQSEREAERQQVLLHLEQTLVDTFCRFGGGMRALEKGEYINVVVPGLGKSKSIRTGTWQDRVYVFKHKDVQACAKQKLQEKALLEKAQTYDI